MERVLLASEPILNLDIAVNPNPVLLPEMLQTSVIAHSRLDESLVSSSTSLVLTGGNGNDLIYGTISNEVLEGGDGRDQLFSNGGNDILRGGESNDQLFGSAADDRLEGGDGNDRLFGNGGNDILLGGLGRDRIFSGSGDDWIDGGPNSDLIVLNGGLDTVVLSVSGRSRDRDIIQGFQLGETRFALSDGLTFTDLSFQQGVDFTNVLAGSRLIAKVLDVLIEDLNLAANFA